MVSGVQKQRESGYETKPTLSTDIHCCCELSYLLLCEHTLLGKGSLILYYVTIMRLSCGVHVSLIIEQLSEQYSAVKLS